jgi:dTDP-4-amino-4,6-dideoxygalactose transaminase
MQTSKKNIPLFKVFMADTVSQALEPVLNSGYVGQGPKVEEFETLLKDYFGTDYLLTMNSCTSALQLANYLIKPPEGWSCNDEILVSPLTCFATVSAIMAHGCKVRWVDTDPNTCNIDLLDTERKLTKNTRAISFVHWGGTPVDLYRINLLKEMYYSQYGRELYIIEDCAHCWNTKIDNKLIGTWGNFACFSLQAIKFLNTADGGFIILPDRETYERAKLLRWFGLDRDKGASFRCVQDIVESGFKYQMNDIAATIGIENFGHMKDTVAIHKSNAEFYNEQLKSVSGVTLLEQLKGFESSYWLYTIKVQDRDGFTRKMKENGIDVNPVHARCDKHSCVSQYKSFLPGMDYLEQFHISIPVGWWLTKEDREYIVDVIKKGW